MFQVIKIEKIYGESYSTFMRRKVKYLWIVSLCHLRITLAPAWQQQ